MTIPEIVKKLRQIDDLLYYGLRDQAHEALITLIKDLLK